MKERIVHSWRTRILQRLADGNYIGFSETAVKEVNWNDEVLWFYTSRGAERFHHDVQKLKNGNYILLSNEPVEAPEISKIKLKDDHLTEVTSDKKIVWEWWARQHFDEFELADEAPRK